MWRDKKMEEESIEQRIDKDFLRSVSVGRIPKENEKVGSFKGKIMKILRMFDETPEIKERKIVIDISDVYQAKLREELSDCLEDLIRLFKEMESENRKLKKIVSVRKKEIDSLFYYPLKERIKKIERIKRRLVKRREIIENQDGSFYLNDIFIHQKEKVELIQLLNSKAKILALKMRDELISFDYPKFDFGQYSTIFEYPNTNFILKVLERNGKLKEELADQKEEIIYLDWFHHNRSKIVLFFVGIAKKYLKK
jgi:hypothetical protein